MGWLGICFLGCCPYHQLYMQKIHPYSIKLLINRANPSIFSSTLACSNAAIYSCRRSTGTTTQGYPAVTNWLFITNRAVRPLPSIYGWMYTKKKCPNTARTSAFSSSFIKSDKAPIASNTASGFNGVCIELRQADVGR